MNINFPFINTYTYKKENKINKQQNIKNEQTQNLDVLEYMHNSSISFQGRTSIPIYAIFKDGSYKRYDSKKQASRDLGIDSRDVVRSSKEETKTRKYKRTTIFVEAHKIEHKRPDGSIVVDETKIQEEMKKFKSAIYAINSDGKLIKFETRKEAAETLKLDAPSITHCLQGKTKTVGGYTFVRAIEIEKKDENGNLYIPETTINTIVSQLTPDSSVYSISPDGSYKKFNSQADALEHYGMTGSRISKCINGETKTVHGMTFVRTSEIENQCENSVIEIDKEKLEFFLKRFKAPIYAIDEKGNFIKFPTRKAAEETLQLDGGSISACLAGKVKKVGNYTFVRADKIEEKGQNGEITVSQTKIKEALINFKTAMYAIDKDGEYTLFNSRKEAAETLKLDPSSISHCLSGKVKTVGGYSFFRANEIDITGNVEEQIKTKIEKLFEQKEDSKIFAIFEDGSKKEFKNGKIAAKELGLDPSSVYKNLRGEAKSVKGITFIKKNESQNKE